MDRIYSEQYVSLWLNPWWWRARRRFVMRHLQELTRRRGNGDDEARTLRILDVGCGGGVAFDDWSRFGEVWGIEPDERLAASTPRGSDRVARTSLEEFEPPRKGFDLIILLDVLEHIEDDRDALHRPHKLLARGGSLHGELRA